MVAVGSRLCRMSRERMDPLRTTKETYRAEGGPLLQGRTRREGTDGGKVQGGELVAVCWGLFHASHEY